MKEKAIFLLGGNDLEMLTIRDLLLDKGIIFEPRIYKSLPWGISVTYYDYIFNDVQYSNFIIYGIELSEPAGWVKPSNYYSIDHHNERSNEKSSLEQIADLLQIELTREQLLIAANDKGFIPAMEAIGATKEEIAEIRRLDRLAQGVTEEDEHLAEKSIKKNKKEKNGITIIKSLTPRFSTLTDRLYPNNKLLIYTDTELNYFGDGAKLLTAEFRTLIKDGKAYLGERWKRFVWD